MQEAEQRAAALVQKGISPQDAVSQIFKSDPDLYRRYRQEAPSSRMVSPLPSYEGNGVHKHAPAARLTIRQAAERVLLDMAEEVVKREGCDPAEAIEAAASTADGRALYNVIRDPRSWDTSLPVQKTVQTAEQAAIAKAERVLQIVAAMKAEVEAIAKENNITLPVRKSYTLPARAMTFNEVRAFMKAA